MQMGSADSTPPCPSLNNLSQREKESDNKVPHHVKNHLLSLSEIRTQLIISTKNLFLMRSTKGSCYRCLKGNRFTEKEVCIVCNAKYCQKCVLRAIGSMPEGRKCVTCIGFRIDEINQSNLGKCSRMLKWLLPESEIKQIMSSEVLCPANEIPPNLVYVNDEPLDHEELPLLRGCPNPPKKLRPGYYWYDKVAGFWGKEGQKPCQIIGAQLNVGGFIKRNASNGNTDVLINGREITKQEVWMLKEAGQKYAKGRIWEKAKILYGVPFSEDECQRMKLMIQSNLYCYMGTVLEGRERFEKEILKKTGKSLLINQTSPSGQERFERGSSREKGKGLMIDGCRSSETMYPEETKSTYSMGSRLKGFSDWLLKVLASGNLEAIIHSASRENLPLIEELWKDEAIQATYNRRNELEKLPRVATYFLKRRLSFLSGCGDFKRRVVPFDMDILCAEGMTSSNGIASMEFSFPTSAKADESIDSIDQHYSMMRYQLIGVHPRRLGENCKWLEMLEDVNIVLFCISLTDYDEFYEDNKGLLINKIEQSPLTQCEWFGDYHPLIDHKSNIGTYVNLAPALAQRAFHYMAVKLKRLFHSLTERKLYVSLVTGLEQDSVDESLKYAREIMNWDEEDITFIDRESSLSLEASTS
ncbi:hypothetical protein ACJRO7_034792 [Eucalyptus globulus]|uniref:Uncharacterized protein n=1 Tax=Eucalyptus globulus TaxID=34317 RepID=A0ABD3J773_EUCGL